MHLFLCFVLMNLAQGIMRFMNSGPSQYTNDFKPITDSQPFTFGHPSQILIRADLGLQLLEQPNSNIKVLYYSYQVPEPGQMNPPSKRKLIAQVTEDADVFVGLEVTVVAWPSFQITITRKLMSNKLEDIQEELNVPKIDPQFEKYYPNLKTLIRQDTEYKAQLEQNQHALALQNSQSPFSFPSGNQASMSNALSQQDPMQMVKSLQEVISGQVPLNSNADLIV